MSPRVSIIIPLHNKGPYVEASLRSVQAQTCGDWETWVVENHSRDDGPERVEALAAVDPRIRLLRAPESVRGPGAARNFGLDHAAGEWVLFLDADDLLAAEHLETLLGVGRATTADVVASDWVEFVEGTWDDAIVASLDDGSGGGLSRHHAAGSLQPPPRITVQDSSIAYPPWAVHCALVRRKALDARRRWVEALDRHPSEDTAFWFRVLWGRRVAYTRRPTAIYRTETPNFRNAHRDLKTWAAALEAIHAENVRFLESRGEKVNPRQAECLMRVWSKLGADAEAGGKPGVAKAAYRVADSWKRQAGWSSPAVALRKLLGCRRSVQLADLIAAKISNR